MRKPYKLEIAFLLAGLMTLWMYFSRSFFDAILLAPFALAFLLMSVWIIVHGRKYGLLFALLVGIIIGTDLLLSLESLKSPVVLSARMIDDHSHLDLILRENGRFEMNTIHMFGEDTYKGDYVLKGNAIIFLDTHYDNDFIPDTLYIRGNRIPCGSHQVFMIRTNNIKTH